MSNRKRARFNILLHSVSILVQRSKKVQIEIIIGVLLVLFGKFGPKLPGYGAKYLKMLICEQVLEFYFEPDILLCLLNF